LSAIVSEELSRQIHHPFGLRITAKTLSDPAVEMSIGGTARQLFSPVPDKSRAAFDRRDKAGGAKAKNQLISLRSKERI
jgi:hypothetical protein